MPGHKPGTHGYALEASAAAPPPTLAEACEVIRVYRHLSAESSLDGVRAADKLADAFLERVAKLRAGRSAGGGGK